MQLAQPARMGKNTQSLWQAASSNGGNDHSSLIFMKYILKYLRIKGQLSIKWCVCVCKKREKKGKIVK